MNEVEWLKSLDRPLPAHGTIDVTPGVMQALHSRSLSRDEDRVLSIAAAIAIIVGIAAATIVAPAWMSPPDPLADFGEAVNLVLR
jgi:hypothetical protein